MRNLKTTLVAAVFAVVFSIAVTASAQDQPGYATVIRVQGIASYSLGDGRIHPLVAGKTLPAGATVYTGENGLVDVVLGKSITGPQSDKVPTRISPAQDSAVRGYMNYAPATQHNVIRLTPGTTLTLDKLTTGDTGADTVGDTELNLQKGRIFASVKKMSPSTQYLVKIPNGVAGIRGTQCSIGADGVIAVFESTSSGVVVSMTSLINGQLSSQTFLVAPGQMFDPNGNGVATIPPAIVTVLSGVFDQVLSGTYVIAAVAVAQNPNGTVVSAEAGIP